MIKKIVNLNFLKQKIKKFKLNNKKIILCHGVFDLLHAGHIMHFQESKNLGDILIVSLTPDKYVLKGPNRPIMNLKERMEVISQLECVDYVSKLKPDATTIINDIRPDIYSKGLTIKKIKMIIPERLLMKNRYKELEERFILLNRDYLVRAR